MSFILSKILLVLIFPFTWVFALLVYAVITKKQKRKQMFLVITLATVYFFSAPFVVNIFSRIWDIDRQAPGAGTYSSIILLGGFVSRDEAGNGHFNWATDRFSKATMLLEEGKATHLLFTGGNADINPDGFTEASFVKTELKRLNIPDSSILLEDKARNTLENAAYSKVLLQKENLKPPYLLVTSAFHMRRALLIFKKAGMKVDPYPCNYLTKKGVSYDDFLPNVGSFMQWNLYIKEVIGYVVAWFK